MLYYNYSKERNEKQMEIIKSYYLTHREITVFCRAYERMNKTFCEPTFYTNHIGLSCGDNPNMTIVDLLQRFVSKDIVDIVVNEDKENNMYNILAIARKKNCRDKKPVRFSSGRIDFNVQYK